MRNLSMASMAQGWHDLLGDIMKMVRYNFFAHRKNHSPRSEKGSPYPFALSAEQCEAYRRVLLPAQSNSTELLQNKMYLGFLLNLLLIPMIAHAGKRVSTLIMPHSQSVNAARELAGWQEYVNIFSKDNRQYGIFSITPNFDMSFRPERIAQCFFGNDIVQCKNTLTIKGSQTEGRTRSDWLADYFGLPTDYESKVQFEPRVTNALVDLNWYFGLDRWLPGIYFRIHAPVVYSTWDLQLCESLISTGSQVYDPGYFNASGITRSQLSSNFTSFINGDDAPKGAGLTFNKLTNAKMSCDAQKITQLSEIQCALGYNVLHNRTYHLGFNIRGSIPTGNKPTGEYLFEPIVGNGHHWELGGGLSTHILVWEQEETQEKCGIYFDANITHLFKTEQIRSFDLCSSDNSRYMLAQKMGTPIEQGLVGVVDGANIEPIVQYQQEVIPIANLTTLPVSVSASVQADLAVMIGYTKAKNSWGLGYAFWGRSCETISLCGEKTPFELQSWALKGDATVYGFENSMLNTPIPLSSSQSEATINHGTNFEKTGATTDAQVETGKKNLNVDNSALTLSDSDSDSTYSVVYTAAGGPDRIRTSIQPILLSKDDIAIDSARTRGISHRMFSHFTHAIGSHDLHPYLSIGAQMEFGQSSECDNSVTIKKAPCVNTALSFWSVWIKGGVAY